MNAAKLDAVLLSVRDRAATCWPPWLCSSRSLLGCSRLAAESRFADQWLPIARRSARRREGRRLCSVRLRDALLTLANRTGPISPTWKLASTTIRPRILLRRQKFNSRPVAPIFSLLKLFGLLVEGLAHFQFGQTRAASPSGFSLSRTFASSPAALATSRRRSAACRPARARARKSGHRAWLKPPRIRGGGNSAARSPARGKLDA